MEWNVLQYDGVSSCYVGVGVGEVERIYEIDIHHRMILSNIIRCVIEIIGIEIVLLVVLNVVLKRCNGVVRWN
jgi:hypothetical protein